MSAAPLPVSVLTGFLGAGKTTLLNRLLRLPEAEGTAVVVNEWGAVPLDHLLVERATEGIVELGGGCLCCGVRGELSDTLADLVGMARRGEKPIRRVVIETSGLADPAAVLAAVEGHPLLARACRIGGVLALVDALHGADALDDHWEAAAQAAVADRLALSKTDLAPADRVAALRARLAALNPHAPVVPASDDAALFGLLQESGWERSPDGERAACEHGRQHAGHGPHEHGVNGLALLFPRPLPAVALDAFLDLLLSRHGERLLRLKGLVEIAEDPARPVVLHGVGRFLHPPVRLPRWPDHERGARLVLIGRGFDVEAVRALWDAVTGRPGVDRPDRAALEGNPLAIAGFAG